jgi:pYEATS domain-containing protein involved in immunity
VKKMIWVIAVVVLACTTASAQELSASNVSTYLGNSRWSWTIFLTGPKEVLNTVSYVEYTLHPTFPNPVQRVDRTTDPRYPFGLTATGWGTFTVGVKVVLKNGQVRQLTHMLEFVSASQNPCGPSITLLDRHVIALARFDKRFTDPQVFIYVDEIRNDWTKVPPTLTIYYHATTIIYGSQDMLALGPSPGGVFQSPDKFKSAMKGVPPDSKWSMNVQHEGDAMQFRYGTHYYLLTVNKVIASSGANNYLELQICERLPSGAK